MLLRPLYYTTMYLLYYNITMLVTVEKIYIVFAYIFALSEFQLITVFEFLGKKK